MDFAYETENIRDICENPRRARRILGSECAKLLESILADFDASANVADLYLLFSLDDLVHLAGGECISLITSFKLVFCVGHVAVPRGSDGMTDWAKVTKIRITVLEAVHG